jgi:hypothetical protein
MTKTVTVFTKSFIEGIPSPLSQLYKTIEKLKKEDATHFNLLYDEDEVSIHLICTRQEKLNGEELLKIKIANLETRINASKANIEFAEQAIRDAQEKIEVMKKKLNKGTTD